MNIVLDVLRYLNEHNITLVKAAEATGVAQQNIKKSIGNNPKASTLLTLAKGLGVDPREFFYDLDEKETEGTNNNLDNTNFSGGADTTKESLENIADTGTQNFIDTTIKLPKDQPTVHTTTFCPHCGARVRVGVVLIPE
jgi:transcriptional regulator with XRE-family HTH domain|nr:MAG TPA_asm: helix-turn-helix domain protein [Caudoviricetes sp.]